MLTSPVRDEQGALIMANAGKGAKGKKIGRNRTKCERYRARGTRELNKARRAAKRARHLAKRAAKRANVTT